MKIMLSSLDLVNRFRDMTCYVIWF